MSRVLTLLIVDRKKDHKVARPLLRAANVEEAIEIVEIWLRVRTGGKQTAVLFTRANVDTERPVASSAYWDRPSQRADIYAFWEE